MDRTTLPNMLGVLLLAAMLVESNGQVSASEDSHSTSWGKRALSEDACRAGSPIVVIVVVRDNRAFQRMLANK